MELSKEISCGLKRMANTSVVSEENLDKLLSETSSFLGNPLVDQHSVGILSSTPRLDVLKESYAALITFLVESIRRNENEDRVRSVLFEHRFQENRVDKISHVFNLYKSGFKNALRQINSDPPFIYDVSWKMNYCVKSSFSDFDGKCLYFIELKSSEQNAGNINFVCTVQQLQSLVASLRAAVRQLENIASGSR